MDILHPLTTGQRRLYLDYKFHGKNPAQNLVYLHELHGSLDLDRLIDAFTLICNSIGIFKTNLVERGGVPYLKYDVSRRVDVETVYRDDTEGLGTFRDRVFFDAIQLQDTPIYLSEWPFLKLILYRAAPALHYFLQSCPHFFMDAYSFAFAVRDIGDLYNRRQGERLTSDLHLWADIDRLEHFPPLLENKQRRSRQYFEELAERLRILDLEPVQRPRCDSDYFQGRVVSFEVPRTILRDCYAVVALGSDNIFFLGVYTLLLQKLLGSPVVIGYPVPNRNLRNRHAVGCFVNTLPLLVDYQPSRTFSQLLAYLKETTQRLYRHQNFDVSTVSHLPIGMSHYYTFYPEELNYSFAGCACKRIAIERDWVVGASRCTIERRRDAFYVELDLGESLRDVDMEGAFRHLLDSVTTRIDAPLSSLSVVSMAEVDRDYPLSIVARLAQADGSLKSAFETLVEKNGERTAVCDSRTRWSYSELNERANKIARCLAEKVVDRLLIVVSVRKSNELIAVLLAILKLGKCYVPADPTAPQKRLEHILEDLETPFLVTEMERPESGSGISLRDLLWQSESFGGEDLVGRVDGASIAYIIYTSGSTGRPKGVKVSNSNVLSLLAACDLEFDFRPPDVWTMCHSYGFDFSVWEMFGCLLHGSRLVIVDEQTAQDPQRLYKLLVDEQVTILSQTPSALKHLIREDTLARGKLALRYIFLGGEALQFSVLHDWVRHHPLDATLIVNMYGITETTVHVTHYTLKDGDPFEKRSIVGKPLKNAGIYILGKDNTILPKGSVGEIFVFGDGVSQGYYRREDITQERFATVDGVRGYHSGDFGKIGPSGDLEYLGRIDRQVKVRGYRVEPGEIESCIRGSALVSDCAVGVFSSDGLGDPRLVAYVVPCVPLYSERGLKAHLRANLPGHMVPSLVVEVERIALTINGKTDWEALSQIIHSHALRIKGINETQRWLFGIICETVQYDGFGTGDNLFDIGLTSLDLVSLLVHVRERYPALEPSLMTLFEHPTVEQLADFLDGKGGADRRPSDTVDRGNTRRRLLAR